MLKLLRFFEILHTIGRYRLDKLLGNALPLKFKLLLLPFSLYPSNTAQRGKRLRHALEELGPIFVKFGQLLSTRPDVIPHDVAVELDHLQDNVAPFEQDLAQTIIETALNGKIDDIFLEFSKEPLASASVAQVHTAKLKTEEEVVVKVIRPEIEKTITKDIQLLLFVASIIEKCLPDGKRLRPVEIVKDYKETIFDELDLQREAANASQLRRNFSNSNMLYVPKVYWDYTRRNVMVMERIYGIQATDVDELNEQNTNLKLLAERGVEIFFTQVFEHNFFHADMHPGNVFVSRQKPHDPSYIAVDMAIVGSLTKDDQYYLARNLIAMFRRDYRQVAELHVLSGWVPKETSISGFESAIRSVCEPIFEKPLKEISFGEALITLFRTARRFQMPVQPQLVLLQKTLLNIEGMGRQLYPDLNLWDTAHPYLERWIKNRYHPKTLWKELKYHSTDWMEKFPEMPHLAFNALHQLKDLSENSAAKEAELNKKVKAQARKSKTALLISGTLIITALLMDNDLIHISNESLALIAIGALIWVLN